MKEVQVKFITDYDFCSTANINESLRRIRLNLPKIVEEAQEEEIPFDDFFATCVSHELIHQIIYDTEGDSASEQFDNICYKKYKVMKHWIGGIGSE